MVSIFKLSKKNREGIDAETIHAYRTRRAKTAKAGKITQKPTNENINHYTSTREGVCFLKLLPPKAFRATNEVMPQKRTALL